MVLNEKTQVTLAVGRTAAIVIAIFVAGWKASSSVNQVLERQDRTDKLLTEVLTKKDLKEMQRQCETNIRKHLASNRLVVNCPVYSTRGQTHRRCPIIGLTDPQPEDME